VKIFKLYPLFFLLAFYSCRQNSSTKAIPISKIESKDTTLGKEIYDLMQIVITEQKLKKNSGLLIDPEDRCDASLEDSVFLKTLLIDSVKAEVAIDTIDWQNRLMTITSTMFGQLDKCLNSEDVSCMLQQKKDHVNFKWDNSKLNFDMNNDSLWYAFSVPLFSKDKTKAVLRIESLCPGLCGTGWTALCKKENGEWKCQNGFSWWH
jgi:hypothetical protein